jgi:hypothetical protein
MSTPDNYFSLLGELPNVDVADLEAGNGLEDVIRVRALSIGLVDVKVCAVDEIWIRRQVK